MKFELDLNEEEASCLNWIITAACETMAMTVVLKERRSLSKFKVVTELLRKWSDEIHRNDMCKDPNCLVKQDEKLERMFQDEQNRDAPEGHGGVGNPGLS